VPTAPAVQAFPAERPGADASGAALVIEAIRKRFGDNEVLKGVSLTLQRGELLAVLGGNGSGKSTLLRCAIRLLDPDAGHSRLCGKDLAALRGKELRLARREAAVVFQQIALVKQRSALENVCCGALGQLSLARSLSTAAFPSEIRERAALALQRVGMLDKAWQRAGTLSGGQAQRVAIARAYCQQATVILADEPVFGPKGLVRNIIPNSLPPDLSALWGGVHAAVVTMCVAILSIAFGIIGALAMLPLAARNITPSRLLYETSRLVQAILRAIPELIMLLFFLIVFGFSPFAAVVALTFHGIGVMGKLFAEAVEEMDMAAVDALRVAGASRLQVFLHAVLPGARNTLLALTMYRLDANFRSAVTLGAVGGGGIGFLIENELSVFQFQVVCTYMIVLVLFVLAIERISTILRARLSA
jgi:phosphonate ABC transporter permease subunit PhnE